ncbi:MAG: hypothetical protein AAF633_00245, partial [Chloroflexota bacterium]
SLPPGSYDLLLNLPDATPSLSQNPAYSILVANSGVQEPATGYNALGHQLTVTVGSPATPCQSNLIFGSAGALGDVSCDGLSDLTDALYILQYNVDVRSAVADCPLPGGEGLLLSGCDVSLDAACNTVDALFILQCAVGTTNLFCPGDPEPVTVAAYRADFQGGTPSGCWSYLWNSGGPIGAASGYSPLQWDGSERYDSDGVNGLPDSGLMAFGHLSSLGGHPGEGTVNGSSVPRYAIAACTVDQAGSYAIANSFIENIVDDPCKTGGELRVYVNDSLILAESVDPETTLAFDADLGTLAAGEKIYVAAGPGPFSSCDDFHWDFEIVR